MTQPLPPLFIIGDPVGHSLSPLAHNTALRALGISLTYDAVEVPAQQLRAFIQRVRFESILGFNVTIPHKESIIPMLDTTDEMAQRVGAVNTVVVRDGTLMGYNTDIIGVEKSLDPFRGPLGDKFALVIGSGGAARAVAFVLANSFRMQSISVTSRDVGRARRMIEDLEIAHGATMAFEDFQRQRSIEAAVIVNATPVGMHPSAADSPLASNFHFRPGQIAFDVVYRPLRTAFLRSAKADGATIINGLPMFLHQAAAAFALWTERPMPLDIVEEAVTRELTTEL